MKNTIKKILLKPISLIYGMGVAIWNRLYDLSVYSSKRGVIPTISVGNITVGGTGKTPHTEYLLSSLADKIKIAYISRGYKRGTKGFFIATPKSNAKQIGDEASQVKKKFPNIIVAVDEDRHDALNKLYKLEERPQLAILDDAYQHRQLKPDLNILLIDYNRLTFNDTMLPYGRLRESSKNTDRADIIIITKCPDDIKPVDCMTIKNQIEPYPYQDLYFTKMKYGEPKSIYKTKDINLEGKDIIVITGIAQPCHLQKHMEKYSNKLIFKEFSDHHKFTTAELKEIAEEFEKLTPNKRAIVTTEKDAARLTCMRLPNIIRDNIYTIGIEIEFLSNGKEKFDNQIEKFIHKQKISLHN